MAAINPDYNTGIRNPSLIAALQRIVASLFNPTTGHDHDGVNSPSLSAGANIANDAVTEVKILDGNVTEAKIGTGAVTATKIGTGAVIAAKLASDAVETAKIKDANVTEGKLATGAVTADKIGAGAVVEAKIGTGAVTVGKLGNLAVSAAKLAADAVETAKIKDAQVTKAKMAADAQPLTAAIADPGDAAAIPVTGSGTCPLVSAAAETRTLAAPTYAGQEIVLACKTFGGSITVTAAAAVDQTGDNTLVFSAAGEFIKLVGVELGAAKVWRVVANDGVALSIV